MVLPGKRMPGTAGGLGPFYRRDHRGSVTAGAAALRKRGSPTWRRRHAPQGYRPKGRDMAAPPESDSSPASSPALVLAVVPVSVTHPPLDDFASTARSRAAGPALGVPKARP